MSVLGLILSSFPYLRSAKARFPFYYLHIQFTRKVGSQLSWKEVSIRYLCRYICWCFNLWHFFLSLFAQVWFALAGFGVICSGKVIMLTSRWPTGIRGHRKTIDFLTPTGISSIRQLNQTGRPKSWYIKKSDQNSHFERGKFWHFCCWKFDNQWTELENYELEGKAVQKPRDRRSE